MKLKNMALLGLSAAVVSLGMTEAASAQLVTPNIGDTGYDMDNVTGAAGNVGKVVTGAVLTIGTATVAPRIARMAVRWTKGGIN